LKTKRVLLLAGIVFYNTGCWFQDDSRQNISLDEARRLFPEVICAPTYIPIGIDSTPRVDYLNDNGEYHVRIHYYRFGSVEPAIEVYQTNIEVDAQYLEIYQESAKHDLVYWLVGEMDVEQVAAQTTIKVSTYEHGDKVQRLFEIVEPEALRANLVEWAEGNPSTDHRVFSTLSAEETLKIAGALTDCGAELATP
jgi:hypothetical protein